MTSIITGISLILVAGMITMIYAIMKSAINGASHSTQF